METEPSEATKSTRTDAQLAALSKARQRAAEVRAQNADVRRKQAEADRLAAEELKRQRVEQADRELKAMQTPATEPKPQEAEADSKSPEGEADDDEAEEIQYVRRKRPTRPKR